MRLERWTNVLLGEYFRVSVTCWNQWEHFIPSLITLVETVRAAHHRYRFIFLGSIVIEGLRKPLSL